MTQEENEKLMYSSPEDQIFYLKCVEGLPTLAGLNGTGKDENGVPLPYGVGPHSVKCLREILEIVNPKSIFEIGFNMGWSASLWLELSNSTLVSCDISDKKETITAARILVNKYHNRFKFYLRDKLMKISFTQIPFDLCFIDGGHLYEDVVEDINLCAIEYKCPFIAFDDIMEEFGPGVLPAIQQFPQLELVKKMGNIALYKNISL